MITTLSSLPAGRGFSRRASLLLGASVLAMTPPARAGAPAPALTPAWFAGRTAAGAASAQAAGIPAQSLARVQTSIANLTAAAKAITAIQNVQAAARLLGASTVPNGLAPGGLQGAPGAIPGSALWQGANLPAQAAAAGRTQVTVRQTAPQAILNWQSFNVGAQTDLVFDQSAGAAAANTWAVLNRVPNPVGPSQVFGTIRAQGQVLVINGNGILFGAGSQVNVNSLIASAGNLADSQFLAGGTGSALPGGIYGATASASAFADQTAAITVQAGAAIATNAPASASSRGGSVLLFGTSVMNAGSITANDGQALLAAGRSIGLRPGFNGRGAVATTGTPNPQSTTLGTEAQVIPTADLVTGTMSYGGAVTNTGSIAATTGDVSLVGQTIRQAGTITATTAVNQRGTIHLLTNLADAAGSVTVAPGSVTAITPETASLTAIDSQRAGEIGASFTAPTGAVPPLNNQTTLPDRLDLSRVEVSAGHLLDVQGGALVSATGGQIALYTPYVPATAASVAAGRASVPAAAATGGRILLETGAAVDAAGALDVTLPASANAIPVNIQGFELRDSPVNRDAGTLASQKVVVDARTLVPVAATGGAAARLYTPGGLLEVSGEVANVPHTIQERLTPGGTVTLAGFEIVAQPGAVINIAGGSVRHAAGTIPLSYLIGADGRLYNVNTAPSTIEYTGVYGGFQRQHARWGFTEYFGGGLSTPASETVTGYSVGRDGGNLVLSAPTIVFEATLNAGIVAGESQAAARPAGLTPVTADSYTIAQSAAPMGGALFIGNYVPPSAPSGLAGQIAPVLAADPATASGGLPIAVTIGDALPVAAAIGAAIALPASRVNTAVLGAAGLSAAGLGALQIATTQSVQVTAPLSLGYGGAVRLSAPTVIVAAPVVARGGSVTLGNTDPSNNAAFLLPLASPGPSAAAVVAAASVAISSGGAIDTRGVWTNARVNPSDVLGEAFVNGGAVTLDTSGPVRLVAGSVIDASAGGVLSARGAATGGTGGDIAVVAFDQASLAANRSLAQVALTPSALAGTLRSVGSVRGGVLSFQVPALTIADTPAVDAGDPQRLLLAPNFFSAGFSGYAINALFDTPALAGSAPGALGRAAVEVAPGTQIVAVQPVYQPSAGASSLPTGSDPSAAFDLVLPPLYQPNLARATLAQRAGVTALSLTSLADAANTRFGQGGRIEIGRGATIALDPAPASGTTPTVTLRADQQITVDGTISAPGGAITITNPRRTAPSILGFVDGLSIWIGGGATLDVSGRAATAQDNADRSFGFVTPGGTVRLGDVDPAAPSASPAALGVTDAFVILRPGSVVDVSGAAAAIDPFAGQGAAITGAAAAGTVMSATAGGAIAAGSASGVWLEGILRASGGGAHAAGGILSITTRTPAYTSLAIEQTRVPLLNVPLPVALAVPRDIVFGQAAQATLRPTTGPGDPLLNAYPVGQSRLAADAIGAAGFGTVLVSANDAVVFDGDVALHLPQRLGITSSFLSEKLPNRSVALSAPVVQIEGAVAFLAETGAGLAVAFTPNNNLPYAPSSSVASSSLRIDGSLIDVGGAVFGGRNLQLGPYANPGTDPARPLFSSSRILPAPVDDPGFQTITIASAGDIRFVHTPGEASNTVELVTPGNLELDAARIYPANGVNAFVVAGFSLEGSTRNFFLPGAGLRIGRPGNGPVVPPPIVAGQLSFAAGSIVQAGAVVAPFGSIQFGAGPLSGFPRDANGGLTTVQAPTRTFAGVSAQTTAVTFAPGSVTSVSGDGLVIPYGGTGDGVTYTVGNQAPASLTPTILVASTEVTVAPGSTIDLRGGGTLAGAAFVAGRGGSTDVLNAPLLTIANGASNAASKNGVFAVIPGLSGGYASPAQTATGTDAALPPAGEQITLPAAAGGLPAGTYTLLPAIDALLPGAYRVELGSAPQPTRPVSALGNGSASVNVITSVANTGIRAALPVRAIVTPGAVLRTYSSYNETTYAQFSLDAAALFSTPRPKLPADAGLLEIALLARPPAGGASLSAGGSVLTRPDVGGRGAVVAVSAAGALELTPDGAASTPGFVSVQASDLSRLNAASLEVGGAFTLNAGVGSFAYGVPVLGALSTSTSIAPSTSVVERSGATLEAGEVFLASPGITIERGAVIDTIGRGAPGLDFSGLLVDQTISRNVVAVTNGAIQFAPQPATATATSIAIGMCAQTACSGTTGLFSKGELTFSATGNAVFAPGVRFGASAINFAVGTVNFGTDSALAAAGPLVPAGLTLPETALAALLAGSPDVGAPPLRSLTLTAAQSVNTFGAVAIDTIDPVTGLSTLDELVLNTPAIEGQGSPGDTVSITTGTLVWNGVRVRTSAPTALVTTYGSAAAPAAVPGGLGSGTGSLTLSAKNIVLGYAPTDPADSTTSLDRTALGYAAVTLQAADGIVANARGTLTAGVPGSGAGSLTLVTPALSAQPAGVLTVTAGGALTVTQSPGLSSVISGQGAQIALNAGTVLTLAGTIEAPAGRVTLAASGDLTLASNARVNVANRPVVFFDQIRYAPGGDVLIGSGTGRVTLAAGSVVDFSATGADAGSLAVNSAGVATLDGTLRGGTTPAPGFSGASGRVTLHAAQLAVTGAADPFAAVNATLDAGGVHGARVFETTSGDLIIGGTIAAHTVNVSADGGALDVLGRIDASGADPGSISLSGRSLLLGPAAVLDAHATAAHLDSYGAPIDAEDRADVTLTAASGLLTLNAGAVIDVSSRNPSPQGTVTFNAPRTQGGAVLAPGAIAVGDGVGIIFAPVTIRGAKSVALNAVKTYQIAAPSGIVTQGTSPGVAGAAVTDTVNLANVNADNAAFFAAVANNSAASAQTAQFAAAYGRAFHLRPGVEIDSAEGGSLATSGDLDLHMFRYGLGAAKTEPGVLALRSAGALNINGALTDGFGNAPANPFAASTAVGITLFSGQTLTNDVTLTQPVTLRGDPSVSALLTDRPPATQIPANETLNFNVTIGSAVDLAADERNYYLGSQLTGQIVNGTVQYPFDFYPAFDYLGGDGVTILFPKYVRVSRGTPIPVFSTGVDANGHVVPQDGGGFTILPEAGIEVPAGIRLSAYFSDTTLRLGANVVAPAGTVLPAGLFFQNAGGGSVTLAPPPAPPTALLYALAKPLPAGSLSWSLGLVAGANAGAADPRAVQSQAALRAAGVSGDVTFNDARRSGAADTVPNDFSVVRTGTGDLGIFAGGSVRVTSSYGIYTAGAESAPPPGLTDAQAQAAFNLPRGAAPGTVSGTSAGAFVLGEAARGAGGGAAEALVNGTNYQANYPNGGGNLTIAVQGDIRGYAVADSAAVGQPASNSDIGNWLFRQGGAAFGQQTAWWINFGTFEFATSSNRQQPVLSLDGFTGFGALGGGNVSILAGGNAGTGVNGSTATQGLVIANAATGRLTAAGLDQTGGGTITLRAGGTLGGGVITSLRGDATVSAAQIGQVALQYGGGIASDPRPLPPTAPSGAVLAGGLVLVPGDATVTLHSLGDLVLDSVGDAGRLTEAQFTAIPQTGPAVLVGGALPPVASGLTGFSLWRPSTAIDLLSAGGNVAPRVFDGTPVGNVPSVRNTLASTDAPRTDTTTDGRSILPATLRVVAASNTVVLQPGSGATDVLELAPAPAGQLDILARNSVVAFTNAANGLPAGFDLSGADPAIQSSPGHPVSGAATGNAYALSISDLFAHGSNAATGTLHAGDPVPARIYAATGDVVGVLSGEAVNAAGAIQLLAAKPVQIRAGRDILTTGLAGLTPLAPAGSNKTFVGDVFLNNASGDVSVLQAGRDIYSADIEVYGPGQLYIQAGRNVIEDAIGALISQGPIGAASGGAGITVIAGAGVAGPDYAAFAGRYLGSAAAPAAQYLPQLRDYVRANLNRAGTDAAVLADFAALPAEQQAGFLLPLYFNELRQSGREFTNPDSMRAKSYARGRTAVATLFPDTAAYAGAITLQPATTSAVGGSVLTNAGGAISLLDPGGQITLGSTSIPTPAGQGVLTQGQGDIGIYAASNVLLGQSRVFTAFGGGITIWSDRGDVNAGRGASSTQTFSPVSIAYDPFGNITLSPSPSTSGAGIATLAPIAGTVAGDVDLIAPLGTIDAGEAGIRVSGNVNLSALTVVNAANIQVSGKSTGLPVVTAPNVAALAAASAGSAATSQAAQAGVRANQSQTTAQPSVITVEVVDFSN